MSFTIEKLDKNMAKLTIEVSVEDFEKAVEAAYQKNKGKIEVPGFRKGKVPRKMIEQMYGKEVFFEDAANEVIPEAYEKAYDECEEEIVSAPKIEVTQIEAGKPFIFTAEVALKPEVKLGKYKGIKVDKVAVEVTEEEVNEDESFEEPETNDFIESINAVDPTISETLTEDRLKYLEDTFEDDSNITEESEETPEEPVQEETEEVLTEDTVSEPEEHIEEDDELEESNEPTEDVFNSPQWDNEVPSVENVLAENDTIEDEAISESDSICEEEIIETETDEDNIVQDNIEEQNLSAEEEVTQVVEKPIATNTTSPTSKIQDDIKSVLVYMDQLLENLPEEKIEEFAKSEHFDTYKKLFSELGISN